MFINKTRDGKNNVCGEQIAKLRKEMKISQRKLADKLQLFGIDVDKVIWFSNYLPYSIEQSEMDKEK